MDSSLQIEGTPAYQRVISKIISYLFHPLFIPTLIFLLLVWQYPLEFNNIPNVSKAQFLLIIFINTAFFPGFAIFLLKQLKFIDSIYMRTAKERIIPYVIVMFFYWWLYYLSRNFDGQIIILRSFFFGIFVCTAIGLIVNNFIKISMHALGLGGALAFTIIASFYYQQSSGFYISLVTLITGIVCTARFIISDHTPREIYAGLFWGIMTQVFAVWFVL